MFKYAALGEMIAKALFRPVIFLNPRILELLTVKLRCLATKASSSERLSMWRMASNWSSV